jgi:hypothetical protein
MHAGLHRGYRLLRTLSTKIGAISMSALGQKQTSDCRVLMSALAPKADIRTDHWLISAECPSLDRRLKGTSGTAVGGSTALLACEAARPQ